MSQPIEIPVFIAAGLLNGIITGLTGGNGMAVLMSILLLAGLKVHNIIGLCLVVQVITMFSTFFIFSSRVKPPVFLIPFLVIPALFSSFGGARLALVTPEKTLTFCVIAVLVLASFLLLRSARREKNQTSVEKPPQTPTDLNKKLPFVAFVGSLSGFAAGLVGGGANIIVANILAGKKVVKFQQAVALSLCLGVLAATIGSVPYVSAGRVNFSALPFLILPALLAASVTARYASRIPTAKVRQSQGVYLLTVVLILSLRELYP
jgi:uncharacterized membrane protein YfcA